jgi:hypothetical protein
LSPGTSTAANVNENVNAPSTSAGLTDLGSFAGGGVPLMLGDLAPMLQGPRLDPMKGTPNVIRFPWARGYKMADNQSPRPQDRVFVAFNFFDDLHQPAGSGVHEVKVYREFFGVEKTFFDQNVSIGLRLPLNTLTASGIAPIQGQTTTAVGDLTVFVKGIFWENLTTGSLLSAGLAVTPPSGPSHFAGSRFASSIPTTSLQPFIGYIFNFDRWYLQGFTGSNIPANSHVVTMYYNDVGIGYYLYRNRTPGALITAVVPTFEVHVNTPLNHRATTSVGTLLGTPDVVDLTFGTNFVLGRRMVVSAGIVNPVTGPRPYELEAIVQLNVYFGRQRPTPTPPPTL